MYAVEELRDVTEFNSFLNFCLSFGEVLRLYDNNLQIIFNVFKVYDVVFAK